MAVTGAIALGVAAIGGAAYINDQNKKSQKEIGKANASALARQQASFDLEQAKYFEEKYERQDEQAVAQANSDRAKQANIGRTRKSGDKSSTGRRGTILGSASTPSSASVVTGSSSSTGKTLLGS